MQHDTFPTRLSTVSIVALEYALCFDYLSSVFDITAADERASADGQPSVCLRRCFAGSQRRRNRSIAACA